MTTSRPRPLWAGRTTALLGILLVALSLRTAVAALSPIVDHISGEVPFSNLDLAIVGSAPPIAFAVAGLLTPLLARRIGLERALLLAVVAMIVGHLGRALAPTSTLLVVATVVTLLGVGVGNVLLPPAVKRYFPDRVGLVTAIYATILSISTAVPALVAVPIADAAGWRVSLGVWFLVALTAAIPWIPLADPLAGGRPRPRSVTAGWRDTTPSRPEPSTSRTRRPRAPRLRSITPPADHESRLGRRMLRSPHRVGHHRHLHRLDSPGLLGLRLVPDPARRTRRGDSGGGGNAARALRDHRLPLLAHRPRDRRPDAQRRSDRAGRDRVRGCRPARSVVRARPRCRGCG